MARAQGAFATAAAWGICLGLAAGCIASPAVAGDAAVVRAAHVVKSGPSPRHALFGNEQASRDAQQVAEWIIESVDNYDGGNRSLPFALLDKKEAKVFVFDADGRLLGAAPALLGLGRGDVALPGIGKLELSAIPPKDRVTQAGRFVSEIGVDSHGQDVLWLDYADGLAIHRVVTSNPKEARAHRLATPTPLDNRISWGCINIPVQFFEKVVAPAFSGTKGIVYVLPETRPAREYFASGEARR
jgi:hypothetical protein